MLRFWHSLYELVRLPLEMIFIGIVCLGIGNLITNPVFHTLYALNNSTVLLIGQLVSRIGTYLIVNFPFIIMIRMVIRKAGSNITIPAVIGGYGAFLAATMVFHQNSLPSTAYSSILGMSLSQTIRFSNNTITYYPIQTGLIGSSIVAMITLGVYNRFKKRSSYGIFSFVSKQSAIVVTTLVLSSVAGVAVAYAWPYLYMGLNKIISFISADTTNPINLALYGITERVLSMFNLGTLIRTPFWYASNGGSWVNVSGSSLAGDVNVWAGVVSAGVTNTMAGRFITPYYILNLFAVPGMLIAVYSLCTNKIERHRTRMLFVVAILVSLLAGTLLPLELVMLVVCPLLLFIHLGLTGVLFAVLQGLHLYVGYQSPSVITMTALPGTLMELLSYIRLNVISVTTLARLGIVGIVVFVIYFAVTRLYFKYMAIDLFQTGGTERMINGTLKAIGGIENVVFVNSTFDTLTVKLHDSRALDVERLRRLGAMRILETPGGFAISMGAASTMIRIGIQNKMRDSVRESIES